jgi:hypothetical protein
MGAQAPRRRRGQGPRAGSVPEFFAGRAHALARRCLGTLDQATRGDAILHRRQAVQVMPCVESPAAEERADPRHGLSQRARRGVVGLGRLGDRECDVAQPRVVRGAQGQVAFEALGHRGSGTAGGDAIAGGLGGDLRAALGHVVVPRGRLDMGQQCRAVAPQVGAAPSKGAGGTPRGGRDRGLGPQAPTEEHGNRGRIDRGVCGLAAVEGCPRAGMPQHTSAPLVRTQSRAPGPGEETFDSHHEPRTVRRDGREQQVGGRLHRAMEHDLTIVLHATDRHGAGMPVAPTVK